MKLQLFQITDDLNFEARGYFQKKNKNCYCTYVNGCVKGYKTVMFSVGI